MTAGVNSFDMETTMPRKGHLVAMDMVFVGTGTGTGIVSGILVNRQKTFGVSPIGAVPMLALDRGVTWTGRIPMDWVALIEWYVWNAIAGDVLRVVAVIEVA